MLRRGILLTLAGLGAGALAGIFAAPLITDMLVGVSPTDPATLSGAALFLACIAGFATLIPALRATRVDPIRTLRSE
jgi:ABC-type antimicrobial peptide transport system permease subunit